MIGKERMRHRMRSLQIWGETMELTYEPAVEGDVQIIFNLGSCLIDRYEDVASIDYDRVLNWMRRKIFAGCTEAFWMITFTTWKSASASQDETAKKWRRFCWKEPV